MRIQQVLLFTLLFVLVASAIALIFAGERVRMQVEKSPEIILSDPELFAPHSEDVLLPYGEVDARMGEPVRFANVSLKVLSIVEESRCPQEVQCIQAGTVRVSLETVSGLGTSTQTLALGDTLTTEAESITFLEAKPYPVSTMAIPPNEYVFRFKIEARAYEENPGVAIEQPPLVQSACYVGGCSSQLCTDTPDMASTCEYREVYACYKGAQCERQANGACGWTPTPQLSACLAQP